MALLEVCVDSLDGLERAQAGGASRIELCSRLDVGGLSPRADLLSAARAVARVPLHVMVRPRPGDFVYDGDEFATMRREIAALSAIETPGVVFGLLGRDGAIDRELTRELVAIAHPMSVTFHRAFDEARDLDEALDVLIELGIDRVLTSGGKPDAFEGRHVLRRLVERARGRIVILPGGGVRAHNAAAILADSGATELHSSTPFRLE